MHNVKTPSQVPRKSDLKEVDKLRNTQEWEVNHIRINDSSDIRNSFFFGQNLGKGSFGVVYRIREKNNNKEWAMKIINKSKIGTDRFRSLEREIKILKKVKHPHVVYLDRIFESPKRIYLLLEMCREELGEIFKRKHIFTEDETRYVIAQLASAVAYLHRNLIVHRDLKLENVLMAANPLSPNDELYIKVTDFGLGVILSGVSMDDMLHDICGTLTYMAPEMLAKNYNQQCDVWAMGVIMYLLIQGEFPFYNTDENELIRLIRTKEVDLSMINISSEGYHLINKMLTKNPTLRIAATEIELHPWILHKTMSRDMLSQNVIDMMKSWKNEMMTNVGDECDWVAFPTTISSHASIDTTSTESLGNYSLPKMPDTYSESIHITTPTTSNMNNDISTKFTKKLIPANKKPSDFKPAQNRQLFKKTNTGSVTLSKNTSPLATPVPKPFEKEKEPLVLKGHFTGTRNVPSNEREILHINPVTNTPQPHTRTKLNKKVKKDWQT